MFFNFLVLGLVLMFFYLWGDYMKILILLEIVALVFVSLIMMSMKMDYFTLNFFFSCLIFFVCESSLGFLLFIFYISMDSELAKKLMLIQF